MKTKLIAPLFLLAMLAQGCVVVSDDDNTITVYNDSDQVITALFITEEYTFDWGPDVLGGTELFPGESVTVEVGCDTYDIQVVGEFSGPCDLYGVEVCFGDDDGWVVDDDTFTLCETAVTDVHGHKSGGKSSAENQAGATL